VEGELLLSQSLGCLSAQLSLHMPFVHQGALGEHKANTMRSAATLRIQIEAALADRISSALTPAAKTIREVVPTGIGAIDAVLDGGLPVGAVTEMIGAECSGRTALALSFLAQLTKAERVCAWIDVSNALSPESAAASGIDLKRLLWVRCGVQPASQSASSLQDDFALPEKYLAPPEAKRGLHGGGFGPHPRTETKSLPDGVSDLLRRDAVAPRCAEPQRKIRVERETVEPHTLRPSRRYNPSTRTKPWSRIEQALRVTDLLLQAGGFSAIVLDLGSIAPEHLSRIPLATWFRYGGAAERSRTSVVLLTQHACSKSSAGLVLRLHAGPPLSGESTVLAVLERYVEVSRQRFAEASAKVVPFRKPPQRASGADWQSKTAWVGIR
jgi:recombination protein RecA